MDKLADGLQKLNEDDLLQVVQMVHDNKAADSYTKNDVERKFLSIPGVSRGDKRKSWLLLDIYSEQNANLSSFFYSRRIPRGLVHSPRRVDQNALGFHGEPRSPVKDNRASGRGERNQGVGVSILFLIFFSFLESSLLSLYCCVSSVSPRPYV